MQVIFFDDNLLPRFYPLTYSRSFAFIRSGIFTQSEWFESVFDFPISGILTHPHLTDYYQKKDIFTVNNQLPILFINSRISDFQLLKSELNKIETSGDCLVQDDTILALRLDHFPENVTHFTLQNFINKPIQTEITTFQHTWDLVLQCGKTIQKQSGKIADYLGLRPLKPFNSIGNGTIWVGDDVTIHPTVAFDLRNGDVILDSHSEIMAQSTLVGPVYIGKFSKIKIGAKIYQNTAIGHVCKMGGEIEDVIIQGYSNKQHDGFLGHAMLGEWCNLGADTNNSDLKNTYASVDMWELGKYADTQSQFMGLVMGDHSKTGINTQLNTGTVIGFSSNVFGSGFPERFIPSFHWSADGKLIPYRMNKAIETAQIVLSRRQIPFAESDHQLFQQIKILANSVESVAGKGTT